MGGSTIWLVGSMGAGKTAVGKALAARREMPFFDSDAEVERAANATVAQIFEAEGEAAFRARERRAIQALLGRAAIVALGGGAIAQPGMAELLRGSGTVVYLRAGIETLAERLADARDRPLLAGRDANALRERLRALLAEREIHYGSAEITIETDGLDVEQVAERIATILEPEGKA